LFHAFRSLIRNQAKNKGMQKEAPTGLRPSHAFSSKAVKIQRQTAGLLTRSRRQTAFPGVSPVAKEWFATLIAWNSQQRDCSGLSPDSLLIGFHSPEPLRGKDRKFFLFIQIRLEYSTNHKKEKALRPFDYQSFFFFTS